MNFMSALHEKPRSVQVSSTSTSAESSNPSEYRLGKTGRLSSSGKVLRVVLAVGMMFACAFASIVVVSIPSVRSFSLAHPYPQGNIDDVVVISYILLAHGAAVVLALILCCALRRTLDRGRRVSLRLRLTRRALLWVVGMILTAIAVDVAVAGIVHVFGFAAENGNAPQLPWWAAAVMIGAQAFLLQGIPEEIIWRGWLFSSLGETRFAAVASVLGFTALHLVSQGGQQNLLERITYLALPCGFAIAALIVRFVSGSTWAAIGVHGGFQVANDVMSGPLHLPNGSVTWMLQGVLWAAVGLLILGVHRRQAAVSSSS